MPDIVTDISINQNWNARKGANNPVTFTFTQSGSAFNISTYTFSVQLRKFGRSTNLLNLTQGSGITNNGAAGTLNVVFTSANLTSLAADDYYWQMTVVHPDTFSYLWFQGTFNLYTETYTGDLTSAVSGTIDINGTTINTAITLGVGGGGSMTYPGVGIALSTGSAWGTSITNNSSNWNTAFGWGNHAGLYLPLSLTGTTSVTGSQELNLGTYASPLYANYSAATGYVQQLVKATSDNTTLLNPSGFQISLNNPASVFKFIGPSAPSVGHVWTASNVDGTGYWAAPSAGSWGSITGTLSSQTDLQNALDDKFSLTNGGTLAGASVLLDGAGNTFTINNVDVFTLGATASLDFDAPAFTFSNGPVSFEAGTTSYSSLKIPHGVAPTSPVDGDFWSTTSGFFGRVNGSTVSFGGGGSLSGLTAATGTNTIDNVANNQEWQWNSLASGTGLLLSSSSTAADSNTNTLFRVNQTGANATSTQTTYSGYFSNTKTGTSSTNVGLYSEASGGTTNLAVKTGTGSVLIGNALSDVITANTRLDVRGTGTSTELIQRWASSTNNQVLSVTNQGQISLSPSGGVAGLSWGGQVQIGSTSNGTSFTNNGTGIFIYGSVSTASNNVLTVSNNANLTATSGTQNNIMANVGFAPTSGTAAFNGYRLTSTINQTGGANGAVSMIALTPTYTAAGGDVYGFRYEPTVTSVTGVHYSFRATSGNILTGATAKTANTGELVMILGNATTNATAAQTNGIVIHAKDSSDGSANSTLALYTEQAPEATATFTQTHRVKVWWNNTEYWLSLDAV